MASYCQTNSGAYVQMQHLVVICIQLIEKWCQQNMETTKFSYMLKTFFYKVECKRNARRCLYYTVTASTCACGYQFIMYY